MSKQAAGSSRLIMNQDCTADARSVKVFANNYCLHRGGLDNHAAYIPSPQRSDNSRCCVIMTATSCSKAHPAQASETLCRKGGTSRSDNAPLASGACEVAKLACGATLSATREFAWLAWLLNSLLLWQTLLLRETVSDARSVLQLHLLRGTQCGSNENRATFAARCVCANKAGACPFTDSESIP